MFRTLFPRRRPVRSAAPRLGVEQLEDRLVPSASLVGPEIDSALTVQKSSTAQVGVSAISFVARDDDDYVVTQGSRLSVTANVGVLKNDSYNRLAPRPVIKVLDPLPAGLPKLRANGTFDYQPPADFTGVVSFRYRISSGPNKRSEARVTIKVNAPPVAADDLFTVYKDRTLTVSSEGGVLANDRDESADQLTANLAVPPNAGVLQLASDGSFAYTSPSGFTGLVSFTYQAKDADKAASVPATVRIHVLELPQLNANAGTWTVSGPVFQQVALRFADLSRDASFFNEIGLIPVEDEGGSIRIANPDGSTRLLGPLSPDYLQAARNLRQVVFAKDQGPGTETLVHLAGGSRFLMYLAQDSSFDEILLNNPSNAQTNGRLMFFSIRGANPGSAEQLRAVNDAGVWTLKWEDILVGATITDTDFNDAVFTMSAAIE